MLADPEAAGDLKIAAFSQDVPGYGGQFFGYTKVVGLPAVARLLRSLRDSVWQGRGDNPYVTRLHELEPKDREPTEVERLIKREAPVPSHGLAEGEQPAEQEDIASYEEAFSELYDTLGQRYPCFEMKGIDWEAVGAELIPVSKTVRTQREFALLCHRLMARLEDSHAHMLAGDARPNAGLPIARWDPGFACLVDDRGRPVVYHVDEGSPAQSAGLRVGMALVSINGKPAERAIAECMEWHSEYTGYSSERLLRYQAARWFIRQREKGAPVEIEAEDPEEILHRFVVPATRDARYLPRLPVPIEGVNESANVSWKRLDDNIGYIYVRRVRGDLIEQLDRAAAALRECRGLVIDVRGNSGGGFDAARSFRNFDPEDQEEPDRPRFTGPMAVLIDARCISAGEGWASWFVANRRAKFFGETTAGASGRKTTVSVCDGLFRARFPIKAYRGSLDRPIERRGIEPDVPLMQNAEAIARGEDVVLNAAREHLLDNG